MTVELTRQEAMILRAFFGKLGGSCPQSSLQYRVDRGIRAIASEFYDQTRTMFDDDELNNAYRDHVNGVWFK